jgi:hypothetical protein
MKIVRTFCAMVVAVGCLARPAGADWLLTGFVAPLLNVKTSAASEPRLPSERFDDSVGFGVNLASAFPSRGNLGFELDWSWNQRALRTSDIFGTLFASRLMSISTNFFYSPADPRVRPYFSVGPSFHYRIDDDVSTYTVPSGWAAGVNGGAGLIAFITNRFGGRIDVRYYRNFGAFYDLRTDVIDRNSGWNNLQYLRVYVGATVVL